jgi:hypothetical protein
VGLPSSGSPGFPGARLFAIGDLNNDKLNDIVTVADDLRSFAAHYFQDSFRYLSNGSTPVPGTITQVQIRPGGLALTLEEGNQTWVRVYRHAEPFRFVEEPTLALRIAHQSQPFYADIDGDLQ